MQESTPAAINEQKDFTNLLAVREYVDDLVKNCASLYESFAKTVKEDEEKNEPLKPEFREYKFKHNYKDKFQVIVFSDGSSKFYEDYANYSVAANGGGLQGVSSLEIRLNLSYKSGKEGGFIDHDYEFRIKFEPGKTSFKYTANFDDPAINGIRDKLLEKLEAFPVTNTIFSRPQ